MSFTQKALTWIEQSKTLLIACGLVAIVVVVAVFGYRWYVEDSTRKASKAFMDAREILDARVVPNDAAAGTSLADGSYPSEQDKYQAALSNFEQVRENHGSAATATLAEFFIGKCQAKLGEHKKAIEAFETYLDEAGASGELAPFAVEGIAAAYENMGDLEQAKKQYKRLTEDPFSYERARGLYNLARLEQEAGHGEEAAKQFKAILKDFPDTAYSREIQERLSMLPVVEEPAEKPSDPSAPPKAADEGKNG